jgi:hypothetical protein
MLRLTTASLLSSSIVLLLSQASPAFAADEPSMSKDETARDAASSSIEGSPGGARVQEQYGAGKEPPRDDSADRDAEETHKDSSSLPAKRPTTLPYEDPRALPAPEVAEPAFRFDQTGGCQAYCQIKEVVLFRSDNRSNYATIWLVPDEYYSRVTVGDRDITLTVVDSQGAKGAEWVHRHIPPPPPGMRYRVNPTVFHEYGYGNDLDIVRPVRFQVSPGRTLLGISFPGGTSWSYTLQPGRAYALVANIRGRKDVLRPDAGDTSLGGLVDISSAIAEGAFRYTGIGEEDGIADVGRARTYADRLMFHFKLIASDILGFQGRLSDGSTFSKRHEFLGSASLGLTRLWEYFGADADFEFGVGAPVLLTQSRSTDPNPRGTVAAVGINWSLIVQPTGGRLPLWASAKMGLHYWNVSNVEGSAGHVDLRIGGCLSMLFFERILVSLEYRKPLAESFGIASLGLGFGTGRKRPPASFTW